MENPTPAGKLYACGGGCVQPVVISIRVTGRGEAQDLTKGFVVKKLCGKCSVADARLVVLSSVMAAQPFQILVSLKGDSQRCAAADAAVLSLKDIEETYGKPIFLTYQVCSPVAVTEQCNAFSTTMSAARQLHWPSTL